MGLREKEQSDRRFFERFNARFPAKVKDSRDDFGSALYLRDASAQGARMRSNERYNTHDHLTVEVKLPDNTQPLTLRGSIVWAHKESESSWDLGLKFDSIRLAKLSHLYEVCTPPLQ